jgi:hypothetical protein
MTTRMSFRQQDFQALRSLTQSLHLSVLRGGTGGKASTVLQFVQGLRGDLHVTLEEGTWAAWLYDLLRPHAFS